MAVRIQFRRGTASQWTSANPTLSAGEFGFESDTGKFKIGNGSTAWASLTYLASGTITGVTAGSGLTGGGTSGSVTLAVDSSIYISPQIVDAKGDLVVGTGADTPGRLAVGSNGQVLIANSATSTGLEWSSLTDSNAISKTTIDAKGDLLVGTADDTVGRLSTGTSGQVLTVDTSTATGLSWKTPNRLNINTQTGTTYTIASGDLNNMVTLSNSSAIAVTIPNGVFVAGDQINLVQLGSGQVTISGAGGVTVNGTPGNKLRAQYSAGTIICLASNQFVLVGDLAS